MSRSWAFITSLAVLSSFSVARADVLALTNAHIYSMGPAGEIASGVVLIENGKIAAVGPAVAVPENARKWDVAGRIVTPGFIMAGTTLSIVDLPEYGILDDSATANPKVSAGYDVQYSVNPENVEIVDARADGVTSALVTPGVEQHTGAGGLFFGGQAALIHLSDEPDLLVKAHTGVTMEAGAEGAGLVGGGRGAEMVLLRDILADVRRFAADRKDYDQVRMRQLDLSAIDLEALVPVVSGAVPLLVHVDRVADIRNVLKLAKEERIKVVLVGAQEAWVVAREIAAAGVPVIIDPEANIPEGLNTLAATYENAARLDAAGVVVAFQAVHARPHYLIRSPRVVVGHLVGQSGLPYTAALAALTINAAKIAGTADRMGSIAPGKTADLVVWNADPLEVSSYPERVFIAGREQSLVTRQQTLGERYLKKYRESGVIPLTATAVPSGK